MIWEPLQFNAIVVVKNNLFLFTMVNHNQEQTNKWQVTCFLTFVAVKN